MDGKEQGEAKRPKERLPVLNRRPEYERLGRWLRRQREAQGHEQRPISRALDKPNQYLNKIEQGKQRIDVVEFLDLAKELGIDPMTTLADLMEQLDSSA